MRGYALALLLPLAACGGFGGHDDGTGVAGTGSGNARTFQVADFTEVALQGPDDVDVRVGSAFSVRAEGAESDLAKLKIRRDGDTLKVGRVSGFGFSSGKGVKVYVTMPRITAAEIAGSGDLSVDRAETASFRGELMGSGDLSIGALATGEAKLSIAGSGTIKAAGRADRLVVDIAGAGDVEAAELVATSAKISTTGAGDVRAKVNGDAKVEILGAGDVDLGPGARCQTSKMGSGTVRCG